MANSSSRKVPLLAVAFVLTLLNVDLSCGKGQTSGPEPAKVRESLLPITRKLSESIQRLIVSRLGFRCREKIDSNR
jgi:hypothetical protein